VRERTAGEAPRDAHRGRGVHAGQLEVTEREQDGVRVLGVTGELDLSTAPALCLRLEAARHVAHPNLLVDLSELEFCDSTGLRALILAAQEITACAGTLGVVVPTDEGPVAKMFMISGAVEYLPLFPALADGLAALARSG
jgi:anti-sigma B factor antagonist